MKREVWLVKFQSQNIVSAVEEEQKPDFAPCKRPEGVY